MSTIPITALPNIGNLLTSNSILPIVSTVGSGSTDKVTVGALANYILVQTGNALPPAQQALTSQTVTNAAQPNITSVGTLTNLSVSGISNLGSNSNLIITGGTSGYVLSTNGSGNLSWIVPTSGATGPAGTNGATGATGSNGTNGATGLTGATGTSGSNGSTGATGTAGTNGATGATGTAGTNGATGATGTAGTNGATGATGINGAAGATGATGTAGTNGATGATGINGATGVTGATGLTGATGTQGATGLTGATGAFSGTLTSNLNANTYSISNVGNITATGNITANNFSGNITITGNVTGTSPNVTLVAGSYSYVFDNTGNFTMPANSDIIMTGVNSVLSVDGTALLGGATQVGGSYSTLGVKYPGAGTQFGMTLRPVTDNTTAIQFLNAAGNSIGNIKQTSSTVQFVGDGSQLSNVATSTTGSWTLATGTNTVSLTVPINGTYSIWVRGNIPNGIVTYTATAVVTNTNVPVLGSQYGWYYLAGNALVLTAIPTQFVGTQGAISNAAPYSGNTANVFTFGITNNSGSSQVVSYGWTKLG
jgi:Collagen triple helix repeat (20 copies)